MRALALFVVPALLAGLSSPSWAQGLGTHDQFDASGVTLLGWVHAGNFQDSLGGEECWGYTSPSGREYAIYGATDAIGFVEVTNPTEPVVIAGIPAVTSNWHDIKTYSTYAYSVSEGGGGIQVIDLSQIDSGVVTHVTNVLIGGSASTHNVAIDETSGFLYRLDGGGFAGGLRIYDLANPALPVLAQVWTIRGAHDAQFLTYPSGPFAGRQIGFLAADANGFDGVSIIDVTDKFNIQILGEAQYPNQVVTHQGWLSEDLKYWYHGDEADETAFGFSTRTHVFDVSDLTSPTYQGFFTNGNSASDHNLYASGSKIYEANFMSGLRVYDTSLDPLNPTEIAHFDVHTSSDQAKTEGLWSNYPFFSSGTILGSDEVKGLFVWRLAPPSLTFSFPNGLPDPIAPDGESILVHIDEENPGDLLFASPTLHLRTSAGSEVSEPLVSIGGGDFIVTLPASASCGSVEAYRLSARSTDNLLWRSPMSTENDYHFALVAYDEAILLEYDMETAADWTGGVAGDTASTGVWVRAAPIGTTAQSEIDHSPRGRQLLVHRAGSRRS